MPHKLAICLQGVPATPNYARKHHTHWTKRYRADKQWKQEVWVAVNQSGAGRKPPHPLSRANVTLIRHSTRRPDFEGLVHSFKPVLDGLVEAGVLVDDSPLTVGQPTYIWQSSKQGEEHVEILVEEIAAVENVQEATHA